MGVGAMRNTLCRCGSGKKYKDCHLPIDEGFRRDVPGQNIWSCRHVEGIHILNAANEKIGQKCAKCGLVQMYTTGAEESTKMGKPDVNIE